MDVLPPAHSALRLSLVSPHQGAEVEGLDITCPLDPATVAALRQALGRHGVLFFRGQRFDHDTQKRFGRYFGDLDIHPNTPRPPGQPEIMPVHADARSKIIAGERWHSDVSCLPENEGEALLRFLFEHAERPDFQIRFRWQPDSVAFWDNRAVLHLAIWDYVPQTRSGARVTVKGEALRA